MEFSRSTSVEDDQTNVPDAPAPEPEATPEPQGDPVQGVQPVEADDVPESLR